MDVSKLLIDAYKMLDEAQVESGMGDDSKAEKILRQLNEKIYDELGRVENKDDHPAEKTETSEEPAPEEQPRIETTES